MSDVSSDDATRMGPGMEKSKPACEGVILTAFSDGCGSIGLIKPSAKRGWIEECRDELAEQRGALETANAHGWEVVMPIDIAIDWRGGRTPEDLVVRRLDPLADGRNPARSEIGEGIVTFDIGHSLVVPKGWNLLLTGPHNNPKRGISPLAVILDETSAEKAWSISWMMTTVGTVVFEQGEAFCLLLPVGASAAVALGYQTV